MSNSPNEGLAQMAQDRAFSSRWGISTPRHRYVRVPNYFFDCYAEAGVTGPEFLLILHLARYQFEKPGSRCCPSVETVARQMGYSVRGLQQVLARLEERGLLVRHYRHGHTTVYDFSGFGRAVQAVKQSAEVNPSSPPEPSGGEPQFGGGVNPSSPEEEHTLRTNKHDGADGLTDDQSRSFDLLVDFGVLPTMARRIARQRDLDQVRGWLQYAANASGLNNPPALVVRRLLDGKPAPPPGAGNNHRQESETATCPACGRTMYADTICPACGKCYDRCCDCEEPQR